MSPVLHRWGAYSLYWYSALIYSGIALATVYVHWQSRRAGCSGVQALDGALWTLLGGLVGARLAYVLPNWADYASHPAALLRLWGGGLVFQGGLIGGMLALLLYSVFAGLSFLRMADLAVPAVALAQGLGWVGAWIHGANYGLIMRSPFSMWLPDLYGVYGPRLPTQLLACALGFMLFLSLHALGERRRPPGTLLSLYLLGNGVGHFALGFARADDAPLVGLLRATQVAELAEAAIAAICLLYFWTRRRANAQEESK